MGISRLLRRAVRAAVGRLHPKRAAARNGTQGTPSGTYQGMTVLEGNPYARYLMPLEYPPSSDYRPRWGYGRPRHAGLVELFGRFQEDYLSALAAMRQLVPWFERIRPTFSADRSPEPGWVGGAMNALDLAVLYYFLWRYRPAVYLEIGSGVSTCFARRAIADHGLPTKIISIDPEPRSEVDAICDEVLRAGLETADLRVFSQLQAGDIVFLDGSHRCYMNSDVTVFMLEVLPRLRPGVLIHLHDIVLPDDYPETFKHWHWNEQYLLAVYLLAAAERIRVLMPVHFVSTHRALSAGLRPPLVDLGRDDDSFLSGGSIWFTHSDGEA